MANGNQIKFGIGFNVEKSGLDKVKTSLQEIQKLTIKDLIKTEDITEAGKELREIKNTAAKVEKALDKCFNNDLGTLNVAKFNKELKSLDINKIYKDLSKCGIAGTTAFRNLATEVLTTNVQLKKSHQLLDSMAVSMKNTVKWGITSSIMNNFTGSVQKAYGYVKDLDSSLNNIRIVSGQTADQMASFAVQANNAAKALGATTTAYSDAALIFYQQGDPAEVVTQKTNATIKMANVLGESAEQVSDYMTAIWNNFDDGSQSLEHYGDVLTALGASTASSSEEIAKGLEKFAGVASTVGLSYEYATSALATVVAETRQSADTVGTAFKTLFARLQGLNLGKTLDDGTTLNKYSEALAKVGVDIKDQNGEMKRMDTILNEIGSKWETLNKDQQVALAQTVAGTRQYNQLVSLMDNWDVMNENLKTAADSTGTLDEQQSIYMDSVEAHLKSMRASFEDVYDSMLGGDSVKDFADVMAFAAEQIANVIDGLGGGGNLLLGLGSTVAKVFQNQIANSITTTISNINALRDNITQTQAMEETVTMLRGEDIQDGFVEKLASMKEQQMSYGNLLSEQQINQTNEIIKTTNELNNQKAAMDANAESANKFLHSFSELKGIDIKNIEMGEDFDKVSATLEEIGHNCRVTQREIDAFESNLDEISNAVARFKQVDGDAGENSLAESFGALKVEAKTAMAAMQELSSAQGVTSAQSEQLKNAIAECNAVFDNEDSSIDEATDALDRLLQRYSQVNQGIQQNVNQTSQALDQETNGARETLEGRIQDTEKSWKSFTNQMDTTKMIKGIVNVVTSVGQLASVIRSCASLADIWNDDSLSGGEKALKIIETLAMIIPMAISSVTTLTGALGALAGSETVAAIGATTMWEAITGPIGWVIAAITLVTVAVFALWNAFKPKTAEERLNDAEKAVAQLKDGLNEAKQAADDLNAAFDRYDSAIEKLNQCTKGTEEWKKTLEEVNAEILEIIRNYPELSTMVDKSGKSVVSRDEETGALSISDYGKEQLQKKANEKIATAEYANQIGQKNVDDAKYEVKREEAHDDFYNEYITSGKSSLQSMDSNTGLLDINAPIDAILDNADLLSKTSSEEELANELQKIFENKGLENISSEALAKTWAETITSSGLNENLQELSSQLAQNTATQEIAAQATADQIMANSKLVQNSGIQDEIAAAAGKIANEQGQQAMDNYDGERLNHWYGTVNETGEKLFDTWAEQSGLKNVEPTDFHKDSVDYKYTDKDGNTQEDTVDGDTLRAVQAAADAMEATKGAIEAMTSKVLELENSKDKGDQALKDFILSGNFENATGDQITDIKSDVGELTDENIEQYFINMFGDIETAAQACGTSSEKLIASFKEGLTDYDTIVANVGKNLSKTAKEAFDGISSELKSASPTQRKIVADAIQKGFERGGDTGAQAIADIFKNVSDIDKFNEVVAGMDWETDDVSDFQAALAEAGVETTAGTDALQNFINTMKDATELDFSNLTKQYKDVHDITDELEDGGKITEEQFAILGEKYQDYFRPLADGTYQLIGRAKEFQEIVNKDTLEPFKELSNQAQNNLAQLDALNQYGKDNVAASNIGEDGQIDMGKATAQVEFLEQTGSADEKQLAEWKEAITNGGDDAQNILANLQEQVDANINKWGMLKDKTDEVNQDFYNSQSAIASTATNFKELNALLEDGTLQSLDAYNEAFKALHDRLDEDIDTEQLERVTGTILDIAEASEDAQLGGEGLSEELLKNEEAAEDVAESILRFDDAIKDVKDNYKGWTETLKKGDIEGTAEAVKGLRDAYADMLDIDGSSLSEDFLTNAENLELMKQAANGSEEAYNSLAAAAANDIIAQCDIDDTVFQEKYNDLQSKLDSINFNDIEIGASLNNTPAITAMEELINAAGMTAAQATDYLASMGIDAEVEEQETNSEEENVYTAATPKESDTKVIRGTNPITGTEQDFIFPGVDYDVEPKPIKTKKQNKAFALKISNAKKSSGGKFKYKHSSNGGGSTGSGSGSKGSKGGGGGGGSKPKAVDKSKNIVDPYHDVNVELKKIQNNLDKISKKQKKLSGQKLFDSMLKEAAELERKVDKINEKIKIAQTTDLTQKKGQLNKDAKSAGVTIKYNKDGTIANYAKVMKEAQKNYNSVVKKFNHMSGKKQEKYQKTLDTAKKSYESFQKSMSEYETLINDTIPNLEKDAQDAIDSAFMRKIEAYRYKIEVTVDLSEAKRDIKDWIAKVNKMDVNPLGQAKLNKDKFSTYFKAKDKETVAKEQEEYRKQENNIIDKRATYSKKKEKVDADKAKIESYEKRIKSAEQRLEKAKKTKTKKDDKKIKNQIKSYKDALDAAQKDLAKHKKDADKAKKEKEKAEKALKGRSNESLNIEINNRQKKIDSLNKTIKNIQKDTLGKQKKKDEKALKDAQKALNKAKKAQEKAKKTKTKKDDKQAKSNYKDAQQEVNKAKKALAATEKKIKANQKIIDKYATSKDKTAVAQAEAERKKQAKQVSSAQKELNKAKKAVAAAKKSRNKKELKKAQAAQKKAQKKVKDAEKKLSKAEKKLTKAEKNLDKNTIKALKKQIANLQIEQRKLTALKMKNSFNGQAVEEYIQLLDTMDEATKALTGDSKRYGDNTKAALEDLQNQQKSLMGTIEEMQELVEKTYDAWMDSIDEAIAGHEKVTHYYEYQNELLEHNLKLVELLGGAEGSFERLNQEEKLLGQELKVDVKNINQLKKTSKKYYQDYQRQSAKAKEYEAQVAAARAKGDKEAASRAEDNAKKFKEAAEKSLTAWEDTEKASRDALINSLETGRKLFETQIDKAKAYAEKQFSGGMGMDNMELEWETQKKIKDQYLDSVNSAYEITKLESTVRKGMNEAKSVTAQNQITKAMKEQLDILKKKDKVSQYEVDRANKVYELTLKQIALEEARNNKNTMKLKRDSQGNYTYEYAADNDAVSQAQDEVNQAQQDLYNFDNEQADAMMEQAMQTFREGQEQIAEAYKAGNTQMAQLLAERYQILTQGYIDQANIAKDNLTVDTAASISSIQSQLLSGMSEGGTLDEMANLFKGLSEEGIQSLSAIGECWAGGESEEGQGILQSMDEATKTAMESIQLSITTGLANSIEAFAGEGGLTSIFNTEIENCSKSVENFNNVVDAIQNATTNGADGVTEALNALDNLFYSSEDATSSIWNFNDSVYEQIDATDNAYNSVLDFDEQLNELTNDTSDTLDIVEDLTAGTEAEAEQLDIAASAAENAYIEISNLAEGFENEFLPAIESAILATQELIDTLSELEDSEIEIPEVTTKKKTTTKKKKKKTTKKKKKTTKKKKTSTSKKKTTTKKKTSTSKKKTSTTKKKTSKKQKKKISAMETGGYTGNWNSKEGKLAILHEKELVLNKQDTKRVLDAVAMTRNMKLNLEDTYKNMLNQANAQKASNLTQSQNTAGTIEQKVEITAEFPGVEKSAEIEQAFNNLINIASQHAYKK